MENHVKDAVSKGAEVTVVGGRDESLGELFYRPSVITGGASHMTFASKETFGPIAPVIRLIKSKGNILLMGSFQI